MSATAAIQEMLAAQDYVADRQIAMAVHLAQTLNRPLLVEGPAGVGKTEIAKVMALALDTELIRLQCYEGLDELAVRVPDWSGGTRISAALATFVADHAALVDHQTVVIIVSDGWDTGDIDLLTDSIHAIQRRSRCLIWLNPLLGSPGYKPVTRGMAAALPHVDFFAPVHNLQSLKDLVRYLMALRGATAVRRPPRRRDRPEPAGAKPHHPSREDWLRRFGVQP